MVKAATKTFVLLLGTTASSLFLYTTSITSSLQKRMFCTSMESSSNSLYDALFLINVHDFEQFIGAHSDGLHVIGDIRQQAVQLSRLLDLFRLWLVGPLPKLSPETIEHQLGGGLQTRVLLNLHVLQPDPLFFFKSPEEIMFFFFRRAFRWPTGWFLFDLEPSIDVVGEEPRLIDACSSLALRVPRQCGIYIYTNYSLLEGPLFYLIINYLITSNNKFRGE